MSGLKEGLHRFEFGTLVSPRIVKYDERNGAVFVTEDWLTQLQQIANLETVAVRVGDEDLHQIVGIKYTSWLAPAPCDNVISIRRVPGPGLRLVRK